VSEPTCPQRDAASLIFNLPGYVVIDAVDLPLGGRRVTVQAEDQDEGCPGCGVLSSRVHAWTRQRVKDIPAGGELLECVVRKPRWVCAEQACGRRTFTQATDLCVPRTSSVSRCECTGG
jgi:transposase